MSPAHPAFRGLAAVALVFLLGCQGIFQRHRAEPPPPASEPTRAAAPLISRWELEGLPGRPLVPVTRRQCIAAALQSGTLRGDGYRRQLRSLWAQATTVQPEQRDVSTSPLEAPLEMLRLTEDLVAAVDQAYWDLWVAYGAYLTRLASLMDALEAERLAEQLAAASRLTRVQLEQARQERIAAEADFAQAVSSGGERGGLLDVDARLRQLTGFTTDLPGLLLPVDSPSVAVAPCADPVGAARTHRLEVVSGLARLLAAQGRVAAADRRNTLADEGLRRAEAELARREEQVRVEVNTALERVQAGRLILRMAGERRQSASRLLLARDQQVREGAAGTPDLLEARRRLAEAIRDDFIAAATQRVTQTDLDRAAGLLLVRDGITLSSGERMGPPSPALADPGPPANWPGGGVAAAPLLTLAAAPPDLAWIALFERAGPH